MESETNATQRQGRDLVAATSVGIGLVAVLGVVLALPPIALGVLVGALLVAAHVELARLLRDLGRPVQLDVLIGATVVLLVAVSAAGSRGQAMGLTVLIMASLLRSLIARDRTDVFGTVGRTVLLGAWLSGFASYALLIRALDGATVLLIVVIGATAMGDVGAYAVGSWIGRRPIAPNVSPNKTVEGLAGGLLASSALAALVLPLDGTSTMLRGAVIGLAVGIAGFLGDLVASMVKRDLGVKDLGRLLPGHGGVLDRVDGLLLALPVGYALVVSLP